MKFTIFITISILAFSCISNKNKQNQKTDSLQTSEIKELIPQKTCPYLGTPIDPNKYFEYKDKKIYVCCYPCLDKVKKNPEQAIKILKEEFGEKLQKTDIW